MKKQEAELKRCSSCKRELTPDCFSKNKTRKDGLHNWCRKCRAEYDSSSKGKLEKAKYASSPKGKLAQAKKDARKRNLGRTIVKVAPPDEPFVYHHVYDEFIAPCPVDIHRMYLGLGDEKHRFMVNQVLKQIYNWD